ncbi:MAG: type II toxin-antitoxin system RelE/ParE family toxin [Betaproteobacteria bacterium]
MTLSGKRVFKLKTFARWAKGLLSDEQLCAAAHEIQRGLYEADLGGGLCKKRVAIPGHGKSGATRTLVAKEGALGIFFIAGRQKSDPGTDFSDANVAQAQLIGAALQRASDRKLDALVEDGVLKEICNGL